MARKSIAELRDSPEWLSLNPKQQKFVELYITNGYNAGAAYFAAYDCKDEHTAHCASYAQLQRPRIAMVLHVHFNGTPEQSFLRAIWNMVLREKLSPAHVEVMKMWGPLLRQTQITGVGKEEKPEKQPEKEPVKEKPGIPSIDLTDFD